MERRSSWLPVVAIVLVVVGLVTLAAPPPAHAFDPQLALALASAAGAIALITGYLIVSNSREKERAASFDGIYTCRDVESSGPMGCAGPPRPAAAPPAAMAEGPMGGDDRTGGGRVPMRTEGPMASIGPMPTAAEAALQSASSPMVADGRAATESRSGRSLVCPGGQAAGPMGCDGAMAHPARASGASAPASMSSPYQGE
ncbi:MAG TPA: hypothetical protein VFT36_09155 [Methylomirabilota bacterium]|nr:hypothetical protein [Methylomirabilota bacterium]